MNRRSLLTFSNSTTATMNEEEEENYVSCTNNNNNMTNSTEFEDEVANYERMINIKIYVLGAMFIMTLFGNGLILVGVKTKKYVWSFLFFLPVVSTIDTQFYLTTSIFKAIPI